MIGMKLISKLILVSICFIVADCAERKHKHATIMLDQETTSSIQKALSSLPEDQIPNEFKYNLDSRDKLIYTILKLNSAPRKKFQ